MKAIKSIAVVGVAAGLLAGGASAAVAHDGGKAKGHGQKKHVSDKSRKNWSNYIKKIDANEGVVKGSAFGSPGTGSGNVTQPVTTVQTNGCGTTLNAAAGFLNPAFGGLCVNR
ncbi:chaplin [Streptomyces sp. 8N706]|uniref:chaplin n=1 Tax=Streptomyces sp. 8N706 TaxID=3457416 RepID=UPI003FD584A2